jgi:protein-L-isoaspartate(D-aspartate) O-methyltransferase
MVTSEAELEIVRRAYAKQIAAAVTRDDPRIETAFSELHREDFLGPGPWQLMRFPAGYFSSPSDDPVYLYQDIAVGMVPGQGLNNGQPSFLAFLISIGRAQEGEHAVHVGAGVGYYTAVIARLVGNTGKVTAIEYEPDLAKRAAINLASYPTVSVIVGDGSTTPIDPADVIYVNAGATRPAETWLNSLKNGGRLILPLTTSFTTDDGHSMTRGAIFLIERHEGDYLARWMSPTAIYPCSGARDEPSEQALAAGFKKGGWEKVTKLYRAGDIPEERCWVRTASWSLAYH